MIKLMVFGAALCAGLYVGLYALSVILSDLTFLFWSAIFLGIMVLSFTLPA